MNGFLSCLIFCCQNQPFPTGCYLMMMLDSNGGRGFKNLGKSDYVICEGSLNRWPQTNVVEYLLRIGLVKYTRGSPPARKMSLLFSIIITIILSYAIIRT